MHDDAGTRVKLGTAVPGHITVYSAFSRHQGRSTTTFDTKVVVLTCSGPQSTLEWHIPAPVGSLTRLPWSAYVPRNIQGLPPLSSGVPANMLRMARVRFARSVRSIQSSNLPARNSTMPSLPLPTTLQSQLTGPSDVFLQSLLSPADGLGSSTDFRADVTVSLTLYAEFEGFTVRF